MKIVSNNLAIAAAASLAAMAAPLGAQGNRMDAAGQDRVCLITWATPAAAATGSDATALSGKYLPRRAAEAQAAQSGGRARVFDYSNRTVTGNTGTFVIDSNDKERTFCEGPEFNPSLR